MMRASLEWMRDYVNINATPSDLALRLADMGFEVEAIEETGGEISGVRVGLVLGLEPHKESPEWQIARIGLDGREVTLVTGARNIAVGDRVPVALPGARLPGGVEIHEQNFRGVMSGGMLCSGAELGLSADASGILVLPQDLAPGADLNAALGLKEDHVLEIETLQRSDCLGYIHLAKEFAAALHEEWREPEVRVKEEGASASDRVQVRVEAPDLCPRYAARLVTDVTLRPSPWWMVRRLMAAGVRPINNLVDITNYVMLEMNQPLHAFDFSCLMGGKIVVRRAATGEKAVTLDGVERTLDAQDLVIADAEKPVAVAGVMGGRDSEITASTHTVLLESACFDPASIRKTSGKLGLRSEASIRFGKGIDPGGVIRALDRAAQLIEELGAGKVARGFVDIHGELPQPKAITVRPARVNGLLGTGLSAEEMERALKRLPFSVTRRDENLQVIVPTFRGDVHSEIDLVEEIARAYGYDNIPPSVPASAHAGRLTDAQILERRLRAMLSGMGLSEMIAYTMVDPEACNRLQLPEEHPWRRGPRVLMPLSVEQSMMRPSLIFGMLDAASTNARRKQANLRFYEIGHVFGELPPSGRELPAEFAQMGVLLVGRDTAPIWTGGGREADFFELKGILENVFGRLGIQASYEPYEHPSMHPGRTAQVCVRNEMLGFLGEVHPAVCQKYDIPARAYYAQVDLPAVRAHAAMTPYHTLPRYPGVERDLALLVPEIVPAGRVEKCIREAAGGFLERLRLFDVYKGGQVAEGWRSLAYSLLLRHPDRTLTEADITRIMQDVLDAAATEVGARRR